MSTKNQNGEGTVYYDSSRKRWVAELRQVAADGKMLRKVWRDKSKTVVKTKMKEYQDSIAVAASITSGKQTDMLVCEYSEYWLNNILRLSLKPTSFAKRESIYRNHVLPAIGHYYISAVTEDDVQELIGSMHARSYSFSTIKKVYEFVDGLYKHYRCKYKSNLNPCENVTLPSPVKEEVKFFSQEESSKIVSEALSLNKDGHPKYRLGSCIPILLYTGMRISELLALTWNDVDIENGLLYITKNAVQIKDAAGNYTVLVQQSTKTKSGYRTVPISRKAAEAFRLLYTVTGDDTYITSTVNHTIAPPYIINKLFNRILEKVGINKNGQRYGVHALRHTFATTLFRNGCDVKIVSELLGHSTVKITQDLYIHVIQEQKVKAIENFDRFLD